MSTAEAESPEKLDQLGDGIVCMYVIVSGSRLLSLGLRNKARKIYTYTNKTIKKNAENNTKVSENKATTGYGDIGTKQAG